MNNFIKTALTIAGSDSSGGAGIQADLKTFSALGVFGMSVITAITAQNTCGVTAIRELDDEILKAQIDAIFTDITVDAVKIGMLSNIDIIKTVSNSLQYYNYTKVVLDTVMISKSGSYLLQKNAVVSLKELLLPKALVVTPNLHEATELVGFDVVNLKTMEQAAAVIWKMGAKNVVVKGGHLMGDPCDILFDGDKMIYFKNKRIETKNTHGTGCTFSSAIAAEIAKGKCVVEAVEKAKEYITKAIEHSFSLGKGVGPTNHFFNLKND